MAFGTIKADGILDSNGETLNIVDAVTNEAHSTAKGYMSAADKVKLDAIAAGAEVNSVTSVNGSTGAVTIQGFSTANNTKLDGIEAGAQVNAANTVVDANYVATDENFTTADHSKLDGIAAGAQVNAVTSVNGATGAVTVQGFSGDYDDLTNKPSIPATDENFTTADHTKLDGIETAATADQTKADIDALNINADLLDGQHGAYYTGYTDTAVANIVDSSPATLNTLNELAAALGDDANFSTTVTNSIATKLPLTGGALTGNVSFDDNTKLAFGDDGDMEVSFNGTRFKIEPKTSSTVSKLNLEANDHVTLQSNNNGLFLNAGNAGITTYGGYGGGIYFKYNNIQKLKLEGGNWTFLNGATVTFGSTATFGGTVTAPAFSGDGSALTNLPAAGVSLGLAIALG